MSERDCLQCGESEAAIKASQGTADQIYCATGDFYEADYEWDKHRFRDWSDRELVEGWGVKPEAVDKYRRIVSPWEIAKEDRRVLS